MEYFRFEVKIIWVEFIFTVPKYENMGLTISQVEEYFQQVLTSVKIINTVRPIYINNNQKPQTIIKITTEIPFL